VNWLDVSDPRWPECINFMAAGIRLCDAVHTVSPSYAGEILLPSDPPRYYGGEGLEAVLRHAENRGVLTGILNGVTYDDRAAPPKNLAGMLPVFREAILQWAGAAETVPASLFIARSRIDEISRRADAPDIILCSVSRLVDQKVRLMRETGTATASALERILEGIGPKGLYFLLGTGTAADEGFFRRISARHENFIFLNGYSDRCAAALYAKGDLFLMPSSFEPCGISQLLAMREGQPCVVHAVGGLKDTVIHEVNGFTFSGTTLAQQADHFVSTTLDALALRRADPERWRRICHKASAARFNWDDTARQYMKTLYGTDPEPPSKGVPA
jgi:starch synthase